MSKNNSNLMGEIDLGHYLPPIRFLYVHPEEGHEQIYAGVPGNEKWTSTGVFIRKMEFIVL